MKQGWFLALLLSLPSLSGAAESRLDETIARNARALSAARAGWQETPLDELLGAAMIASTSADAALLGTVAPEARLATGPSPAASCWPSPRRTIAWSSRR
jgi:hypothetical protein